MVAAGFFLRIDEKVVGVIILLTKRTSYPIGMTTVFYGPRSLLQEHVVSPILANDQVLWSVIVFHAIDMVDLNPFWQRFS
jgi:hypothetical protein